MLRTLKIKNFALISDEQIEFKKGFNVLVGETGAGKSLILDALAFVMGEKANKLNLRHGEEKMFVQAVFDSNNMVAPILDENGIEIEDDVIFTRTLNLDGKSECRVNGVIVPASVVKLLAVNLLDTYAQNENIELLKVKNHLSILDSYLKDHIDVLLKELNDYIVKYNDIKKQMDVLGGNATNRDRELELLEFQIKDIENSNLILGEDEELKNEIEKLSNYEKIFANVKTAGDVLTSVSEKMSIATSSLSSVGGLDVKLSSLCERLSSSKIELSDIVEEIIGYQNSFEYDESRLENLDRRLEEIKTIKRKYGNTIEDVILYLEKIKTDYDNLLFGEEKLKKLEIQLENVKAKMYEICMALSKIRKKKAIEIERNVESELKMLGFKNANFKIAFKDLPNINNAMFTKHGLDEIEFLLSANAGEDLKSLAKTISGGEMSRFMLAIKNVFARSFGSTTLVFDEVDTGISGEIGQRVAERLASLAQNYQLICITHLCQVTAMADNYFFVKKQVENNKTFTNVSVLDGEDIIKYIAVVSGAEPTGVALQFARELKDKANEFKSKI